MKQAFKELAAVIEPADHVVIIQAENPDGDSLSSALALESVLQEAGKEVTLYCPVDIPKYLRFLKGWDRIINTLPKQFDAAIIVDASTEPLLERVLVPDQRRRLAKKPLVVIDHHTSAVSLPIPTINVVLKDAVAVGEIIYLAAKELGWSLPKDALEFIASSILSDSLGLMSEGTTARSIRIIAEVVEQGVSLSDLEQRRREFMKKSERIFRYKGRLFERVEFIAEGRIGLVVIPWEEIEEYSDEYNPSMLIIDEIRLVDSVLLAAAFKLYPDGKITCKLRANSKAFVADRIAEHFGGGGHPFAAGFKIKDMPFDALKKEFINVAEKLLDQQTA